MIRLFAFLTLTAAPVFADEAHMPVREALALDDASFSACLTELDALGVTYTQIDPILAENDPDCGILRPVEVSALKGDITVQPPAKLRCPTALALASWAENFVRPAARTLPKHGKLTQINQGSSYICRRRNNLPAGKPSEHSFGNAIDIMSFGFETGEPIRVEPRADTHNAEEAFQRAVRGAACLYFSTVLGPDTDSTHEDHLHLDIKARRGGWRLCQ